MTTHDDDLAPSEEPQLVHIQRPQGETTLCDKGWREDLQVVDFQDYVLARGPFCERCERIARERRATGA